MQSSIDEFEFRMNEFSELLKAEPFSHDQLYKLENDCKYFANLFADLLRENYKLKDQIIEHIRQIQVYREELMKITFDINQTTNEDRKFSKEMASIEILVKYLIEDQKYFKNEKNKMVHKFEQKELEIIKLKDEHQLKIIEVESIWLIRKNKWKSKFKQQVQDGLDNIDKIKELEQQIINLNQEIQLHIQNEATYEAEITRKDLRLQYYQKIETEFQSKQTDIDIKHDFAMKELQKKYRNEMKELKIQNANNLKSLQNNYEDKFLILQKNAETYQAQLEQKTYEFMNLTEQYDQLISTYKDFQQKCDSIQKDLENQILQKNQELNDLNEKYKTLDEEHNQIKKQLKLSLEEQFRLKEEVQKHQKEIKQKSLTIQSLENKIKDKTERFQRLLEQNKQDHEEELKKLKANLIEQSDMRVLQIQKNAQDQYDLLMRQKTMEIGKLNAQISQLNNKIELLQLQNQTQIQSLQKENQVKINEINIRFIKCKEELSLKETINIQKDDEIKKLQNEIKQKIIDFEQDLKNQQQKFEDETAILREGVELLVKQAKKPLDDKIIALTLDCEQKQNQLKSLQTQFNELQEQFFSDQQKKQQKITYLQDELNMTQNIFNKKNDDLTKRMNILLESCKLLQQRYFLINEQLQSKNIQICSLEQIIKDHEEQKNTDNHRHQKAIKELQIYIGNKEIEIQQINQQYIEQLNQTNIKIEQLDIVTKKYEIEKNENEQEKQTLQKKIQLINQEVNYIKTQNKKEMDKVNQKMKDMQIILEEQNQQNQQQQQQQQQQQSKSFLQNIEFDDKEIQTDIQIIEQPVVNLELYQQEIEFKLKEKEDNFQEEKAQLIIQYEQIIEQLQQQQQGNSEREEQRPQIQIIEKIVYKDPIRKEGLQGLDEILRDTQKQLDETKQQTMIEKQENAQYIEELNIKFQQILQENEKEITDLTEQIQLLKNQIQNQNNLINDLKKDLVEQELKYQIQIQQIKEQSDVQLNTITETYHQEIEDYKRKYDEKYTQFEQLRKQYQQRQAKPEDTEIIQRLLKDHMELYHLVVNAYDKVKEAGDIIKYLDLEVQNYKKANDIFGGQQQTQPPSLSTQKMLQRVAQIKQDLEITQNKIQQKQSDKTLTNNNCLEDKQQSDYSELNSRLHLDSIKLPPKRNKLPKMMQSMKSNLSEQNQQSSQIQTQRLPEERSEVPLFKFDQDDQLLIEAPVSFNAFVDQRQHSNPPQSVRQNKYNVYIEKKKKDLINISDIVSQQQQQSQQPTQLSPSNSRVKKKQEQVQQQNPKKFIPYYLRNPETSTKYKKQQKESSFQLSGNTYF